jgi:hypothetical protein
MIDQLMRWFIHGRSNPMRAKSAADELTNPLD